MQNILSSASKIVFVLMALSLTGLTALGMVESKDFVMLCSMAFTFYFSNKGNQKENFLGK